MTITPSQCRAARAMLRISRQELADATSISLRTLNYFEDEKRSPRPDTLAIIRKALEERGIVLLETWWGARGVLESAETSAKKVVLRRNSTTPSSGEIYINGICLAWDDIRVHLCKHRRFVDADPNKSMLQQGSEGSFDDPWTNGTIFTVDVVMEMSSGAIKKRIARTTLSSWDKNSENIISQHSLIATSRRANIIRFSHRTFKTAAPGDYDDKQYPALSDGQSIPVTRSALPFEREIEHPEYYRKSFDWGEEISQQYYGDRADNC